MKLFRSLLPLFLAWALAACATDPAPASAPPVARTADETALLERADAYLADDPVPLTDFRSERSAGGPRDFYSEGDYWWPDPDAPEGPYIRRDGQTNPDNFVAHRHAMVDLSRRVAALTAAYRLSGERKYADRALDHLRAWFVDPVTSMVPSLLYAQAISGRVTGRGIGIIDTIHLIEVAKSIETLRGLDYLGDADFGALRDWFDRYLTWMTTHEYGLAERDNGNNHSTWWAAQVAAFASLTDRAPEMDSARAAYRNLLTTQMDSTGGFPDELRRTKPYNYTLFNLEGYAVLAHYGTDADHDLWAYASDDGTLHRAWQFIAPYLTDKQAWPYPPDVMYYDQLPIRTTGLLLAARAYDDARLLAAWKALSPERQSPEVERNFPLREPSLWVDRAPE